MLANELKSHGGLHCCVIMDRNMRLLVFVCYALGIDEATLFLLVPYKICKIRPTNMNNSVEHASRVRKEVQERTGASKGILKSP